MKKNNNKRRGLEKERELKKRLEADGWLVARSRGSFGLYDIIAIREGKLRLIQVKRVKGKYGAFSKELEAIKNFTQYPANTSKELWVYFDRMPGRPAHWETTFIP